MSHTTDFDLLQILSIILDLLHAQVVRIIKEWKAKGNTTPPEMAAIWNWEHQKAVDHIARVRVMLNMYAGK